MKIPNKKVEDNRIYNGPNPFPLKVTSLDLNFGYLKKH